ncbi:MAG: tetratricopeptide repeat protein [Deltaproteobacteria bacterium]|nr:tetratricopeptide repeat protein [Deltaproteobacteria bacterium]
MGDRMTSTTPGMTLMTHEPSPNPSGRIWAGALSRLRGARAATAACSGVVGALLLCGPLWSTSTRAQDDGFSFDIVEEGVKDVDTARLDAARDLVNQERFGEALGEMEAILADKSLKKHHEQTEYAAAKALYRMGAYHAALARFQKILDVGPKHPQYAESRNWLFFVSRKIKDELAALQMVSIYAKAEDIPAEQQSELSYALARFYFLLALNQGARGVEVQSTELEASPDAPLDAPPDGEAPAGTPKPADDDGFNFSGDDLGGGDDDGFGFDFSGAESKPAAKQTKSKKKSKEKADEKKPADTPPPAASPPVPPRRATPARAAHKAENPKSAEESLSAALKAVERVDEGFALSAQSTYLKGLINFARGEFEPSVKAFREVVRRTNPRGGGVENEKLREMALFSLARVHYQFEQFRYAIFYYDRISRDSEAWLDAVFESSWAHFRLGEYEKALGNLVTLQSPFFIDEYYPESSILKAITFYENCRYPEARAFLGEFKQNYGGVLGELERLVGAPKGEASTGGAANEVVAPRTAEQLFTELTELEKKVSEGKDDAARSIALTARLLRLALSDKRVAGFREAISEIDDEKAMLAATPPPFKGGIMHTELMKRLDDRRAELVRDAGTLLRDKLEAERAFLRDLTAKLLRIEFEIEKMEKEALEASLANQNQTVNLDKYSFTAATDDERLYWPFEGEYWRDELGAYQYTLTKGCRPPEETTITGN